MWERAGLKLLSSYNITTQNYFLKHFYKFQFVRHPLHRLLSAYRDKFYFPVGENKYIYNLFGEKIKKLFPENITIANHTPSEDFITFKQFLLFVAHHAVRGQWLNDHFSPFYDLCRPCDVEYDFVGKMETMHRDSKFIIEKIFPNSTLKTLPGMGTSSKATKGPEVYDMFQTLPRDLVSKLYFAFQPDFDMYGYSLEDL